MYHEPVFGGRSTKRPYTVDTRSWVFAIRMGNHSTLWSKKLIPAPSTNNKGIYGDESCNIFYLP
jgi:hypothetical protein